MVAPSTKKARALLAYLALHAGVQIARDRLCDVFWPDADGERARANLKTATWSIRRAIRLAKFEPDEFFHVDRATMCWTAAITVDADEFLFATTDPATNTQAALALYRGPFLEGNYDDWAVAERERIHAAYEALLEKSLARDPDPDIARKLLECNPYSERAYSVLIQHEIDAGRVHAARTLVERAREALREFDTAPSELFEACFQPGALETLRDAPELSFVGRENELGELRRCIRDSQSGRGSLILLHGEAGIGKSTLLQHACSLATESALTVHSVQGSVAENRLFGAWEELFCALTGNTIQNAGRADGAEFPQVIAEQMSAALPPRSLLVVDDAHAFTGETRIIFKDVAIAAVNKGILVLCATRPEGRHLASLFFEVVPFAELPVVRLTNEQLVAALRRLFGEGARDLAARLYERASGHPLFVNRLLRGLWREGFVSKGASGWKAVLPRGDWTLPADLTREVELRLRSRGDDAAAVACALALDRGADSEMLCAALDLPENRVLDALDDLLALDIIRETASGAQFAFSHDLIADVAAGRLHAARRAHIHSVFAGLLQPSGDPAIAARRAEHLAAAGAAVEGARAFLDAASGALEWFAWRKALGLARRGIALARSGEGNSDGDALLAELKMVVARAHVIAGEDGAALAPAAHALAHARSAGDPTALARALAVAAGIFLNCHRIDEARVHAQEAANIAFRAGDDLFAAHTLMIEASAHCHDGCRDRALNCACDALRAAQRSGKAHVIAAAADALVRAQITWLEYAAAQETLRIEAAAASQDGWIAQGAYHVTCGALWHYLERYDRALACFDDALRILADKSGERRWQASMEGIDRVKARYFARYFKGAALCALGRYDEVIAIARHLAAEHLAQTSYMVRNNVLHLHIDALLGRNTGRDAQEASELATQLVDDPYEQGSILDFSTSSALTRARVAARTNSARAEELLRLARVDVERHALRTPLECDRALAQLAVAAREAGDQETESVALALHRRARAQRETALAAASLQLSP